MLLLARESPERVEKIGRHAGFDYVLMHNWYGHRLAYVRLPNGCHLNDDDLDCHGGLTWQEPDHAGLGLWVGWDYGHAWDRPDPVLVGKLPPGPEADFARRKWPVDALDPDSKVWTMDEVVAEAERVCERVREAVRAAGQHRTAEMLARAVLDGDIAAADALADLWVEMRAAT